MTAPRPTTHRTEHDALGPVDVPIGALYGPRTERGRRLGLGGRTLGERPSVLRRLVEVKRAAAIANRSCGMLPGHTTDAIERAARLVESGAVGAEHFPADPLVGGGWVAVNANVNEVLANLASRGGDRGSSIVAGDVNRSQSTADVCHTALRVAAHTGADEVVAEARALACSLARVAVSTEGVTTLARTCLQDALAVPAGQRLHGSAAAVSRAADALGLAQPPLLAVTLGATVVGTGAGASAGYRAAVVPALAELTALPLTRHAAPPSALQHSDDLLAVASAADRLARAAAKLASDLRLLSSGPVGGLGEITLPHVLDGSTYFRAKRNPVVPETVVQVAIEVSAHLHAVQLATEHAELDLNVYDGLAAVHTIDALDLLGSALRLLRQHAVDGLSVDAVRCAELVQDLDAFLGRPQELPA